MRDIPHPADSDMSATAPASHTTHTELAPPAVTTTPTDTDTSPSVALTHPADSDMSPTVGPAPGTDTRMAATVGVSPRADTDASATGAPPAGDDSDMSPTRMLSKTEAARYLGVSEKTIERHITPDRYAGRAPQYAVPTLDAWRRARDEPGAAAATPRQSPTVAVALHQGYEAALAALRDTLAVERQRHDDVVAAKDATLNAKDETIAELRRRAEAAEAERDELRARLDAAAPPAAPEAPTVLIVEGDRHPPPPTLWQRLRWTLWGSGSGR